MLKKTAVALSFIAFQQVATAAEYGDYAKSTLDSLIHEYPGRYRGTEHFIGAANLMEDRMSPGYKINRQDFSWSGAQTRTSQNVIASNRGLRNDYIITGAHFDSYYGRPTLEALDDNASGASLLTEVAHNLSGIQTERTLVFAAFGAEEEGLRGSKALAEELEQKGLTGNLKGMINMDSMITGDMLYAHAGSNSIDNPALSSLREHVFRIAKELGIELHTNPGLDPQYPAGTGCCSDGDSFNRFDIPVLYLEATNWDIGDKDGYTQTTNPAVPGGATWHSPSKDNEKFLTSALGEKRIDERLHDISLLLTRLLLEWSNTDLLYSATSAAHLQYTIENSLQRQHQVQNTLLGKRRQSLYLQPRESGTWGGNVGIEGQSTAADGFNTVPQGRSQNSTAYAMLDYQFNDKFIAGSNLSFQHDYNKSDRGGYVKNDTWQFGMYGLIKFENPFWLSSDVSVGRSSIDSKRSVYIESKDNLVLLDNQLNSNTNALFYSGRVNGGYDFEFSKLQTGPIFGFDFTHYRVNAFNDHEDLRTAVYYQEQNVNSFEVSLGWKVTSSLSLGGNHTILPYASLTWVRELSDGIDNKFNIRDTTDNSVREITVSSPDKSYGRGEAGIQWNVGNSLSVYTGVNSRLLNSDGSETQYTVGGAYSF